MNRTLIYRENRLFKIDNNQLPASANKSFIINALYAAIYEEFAEAINNKKYKEMSNLEKMNAVNEFARQWLNDKGFK